MDFVTEFGAVCKIATILVDKTISTAVNLIESDPLEQFFYKHPQMNHYRHSLENKLSEKSSHMNIFSPTDSFSSSSSDCRVPDEIDWVANGEFTLTAAVNQILVYIRMWGLTPSMKYVAVCQEKHDDIPNMGRRYYVDVLFSKPTRKCPNPLAVATVHFKIHVPALLPKYYPIMVTYRFESYKTIYYVTGTKCLRSMSFQPFYIDTILHMKLSFYAELCNCRNPLQKDTKAQATENNNQTTHANSDGKIVNENCSTKECVRKEKDNL